MIHKGDRYPQQTPALATESNMSVLTLPRTSILDIYHLPKPPTEQLVSVRSAVDLFPYFRPAITSSSSDRGLKARASITRHHPPNAENATSSTERRELTKHVSSPSLPFLNVLHIRKVPSLLSNLVFPPDNRDA